MIVNQALKQAIDELVRVVNNPNSTEEEIKAANQEVVEKFKDAWFETAIRIA